MWSRFNTTNFPQNTQQSHTLWHLSGQGMESQLYFTSVWPNDAKCRLKSGAKIVQVMVCCLTSSSHYLNQCWLVTHGARGVQLRAISHKVFRLSLTTKCLQITYLDILIMSSSPKVNELRLDIFSLPRLILGLRPANERRRYKVTPSLIGWAQISPDYHVTIRHVTRTPVCPNSPISDMYLALF